MTTIANRGILTGLHQLGRWLLGLALITLAFLGQYYPPYSNERVDIHRISYDTTLNDIIVVNGSSFATRQRKTLYFIGIQYLLDSLSNGSFVISDGVSSEDERNMKDFVRNVWTTYLHLPYIQRKDKKCGNMSLSTLTSRSQPLTFRALCDPDGSTPCCYEHVCVNKTKETCMCPNCYDLRRRKMTEMYIWKPSTVEYTWINFTAASACDLLDKRQIRSILFMGDSLVRHIYAAFIILMTNNLESGSLNTSSIPEAEQKKCSGMFQFIDKDCPLLNPIHVCGGTITVRFKAAWRWSMASEALQSAEDTLRLGPSFLFVGIGLHDNLAKTLIRDKYIKPLLKLVKSYTSISSVSPAFLWMSPHLPGLLKPLKYPRQQRDNIIRYRRFIEKYLHDNNVHTLNTHSITQDTLSWDGTHYGLGVNSVLSQIILNYLNII